MKTITRSIKTECCDLFGVVFLHLSNRSQDQIAADFLSPVFLVDGQHGDVAPPSFSTRFQLANDGRDDFVIVESLSARIG